MLIYYSSDVYYFVLALRQFIVMQISFLLLFFGTSFNVLLLLFHLEESGLLEFDGNIPELNKGSK